MTLRTMHLFAGAGGGLLGDLILGHEPVCAVEMDPYCCEILRERRDDGWFPGLSVYEGDIKLFDPSEWKGRVDCIHAGFPCQDISVAGKGRGIGGERSGLFWEVIRVAREVGPRYIFLENSPAIVSRGLGAVLGALTQIGYDSRWTTLAAAEVGAPHRRARWWCLADADSRGRASVKHTGSSTAKTGRGEGDVEPSSEPVADANGRGLVRQRLEEYPDEQGAPRRESDRCGARGRRDGPNVADAEGKGDVGNTEIQHPADTYNLRQGAREHRGTGGGECSWWWSTEPNVGRVAHGVAARVHRLKALGNGQVPLQAATAWTILMEHSKPRRS